MNSTAWRRIAIALFGLSLPLTLLSGNGRGWLVDPNGWQGYEIVFFSPLLILIGGFQAIPLGISNAYVVVGMWLQRMPIVVHLLAWLMFIPSTLIILKNDGVFAPIWLLVAAWVVSGIGPLMDYFRVSAGCSDC